MDDYQKFIHVSRYARWNEEAGRRETWEETVDRYINFFKERHGEAVGDRTWAELRNAIINLEVMPSMRCLMTAGPALDRDNVAGYNCSYRAIDHPRAFDEILYILTCGTGVGFSVERQYINKLPDVPEEFFPTDTEIVVRDSRIGWGAAYKELISFLYAGQIPSIDYSRVRPAGAKLHTFGGRASGPEPLKELFDFTIAVFQRANGRKLTSLECHDLVCEIGRTIVVGGVRRSALLSLSNVSDDRMRAAKQGDWWVSQPQRQLANNSACYTEKPDMGVFFNEWKALYESKSGERGIFSRAASQRLAEKTGRRDAEHDFGTNPCSEIILRNMQFCNLSEVIVRPDDDSRSLKRKVRLAAILGTLQATLTDFRYLSKKWQDNTVEEALLGVSLSGIMDNLGTSGAVSFDLEALRDEAVKVNKEWAKKLGINQAASVTCVKPSGTVSQLVDSASGIHPRFSEYYIRRARIDKKDPLAQYLMDAGFAVEQDVTNPEAWVVSFPRKAPKGSQKVSDVSAIQQLELWKKYQEEWCEHKPSCTVYVKEDEWLAVGAWVYEHFDIISGVSFLPQDDHIYQQAPYEEIDKKTFTELSKQVPVLDLEAFSAYEKEDNFQPNAELACVGDKCEI